jgi:hypothetical protein
MVVMLVVMTVLSSVDLTAIYIYIQNSDKDCDSDNDDNNTLDVGCLDGDDDG